MAFYLSGTGLKLGGGEELDDYEEFSWNPGMRTGSYVHFSVSYSVKGVKIGRFVQMTIYGQMTATGSGSADSIYASNTLPYPAGVGTGAPQKIVAVAAGNGTGGGFGYLHNYYGNALNGGGLGDAPGAKIGSHSSGTVLDFAISMSYYTAS